MRQDVGFWQSHSPNINTSQHISPPCHSSSSADGIPLSSYPVTQFTHFSSGNRCSLSPGIHLGSHQPPLQHMYEWSATSEERIKRFASLFRILLQHNPQQHGNTGRSADQFQRRIRLRHPKLFLSSRNSHGRAHKPNAASNHCRDRGSLGAG